MLVCIDTKQIWNVGMYYLWQSLAQSLLSHENKWRTLYIFIIKNIITMRVRKHDLKSDEYKL